MTDNDDKKIYGKEDNSANNYDIYGDIIPQNNQNIEAGNNNEIYGENSEFNSHTSDYDYEKGNILKNSETLNEEYPNSTYQGQEDQNDYEIPSVDTLPKKITDSDRRQEDRRVSDRRQGDRRKRDRRKNSDIEWINQEEYKEYGDRRKGNRRQNERRQSYRRRSDRSRRKKLNVKEIITWSLFVLIVGGYFGATQFLPDILIAQGKRYMDAREYQKAADLYAKAIPLRPFDNTLVYNRILALSKLPKTPANQEALLEAAKMENCEDASLLADEILDKIHSELIKNAGSNYIDNAPYNQKLVRWNNSKPITYRAIGARADYNQKLENAFFQWQNSIKGKVKFVHEYEGIARANITIHFVKDLKAQKIYEGNRVGATFYTTINGNILDNVDIYIRTENEYGMPYSAEALFSVFLHEIGHALGIYGHSINENDVMHYYGDFVSDYLSAKSVSKRDINTVNLLYDMILPDEIDINIEKLNVDAMSSDFLATYSGENFEYEIKNEIEKLKKDKRDVAAWVDIAIGYAEKHQLTKSNFIFENILPLIVDDVHNQFVVYYNLAVNYYKLHEYDKAAKYLMYARYFGDDLETQILDAFIKFRQKNPKAEAMIMELNEKHPRNIEIALKLSEVYILKKDQKKARAVIDELLKVNPEAIEDPRIKKYKVPLWRVFYNKK